MSTLAETLQGTVVQGCSIQPLEKFEQFNRSTLIQILSGTMGYWTSRNRLCNKLLNNNTITDGGVAPQCSFA